MTDESVHKNYKNEGGNTEYLTTYKPGLLTSIPRIEQRSALGITEEALPFGGMDFWNAFEFSWLNNKGKPEVAVAQFQVPCQSTNIIESKSLKFYLGSYSNTKFSNRAEVISNLESDLTLAARAPVSVTLMASDQIQQNGLGVLMGQSLDHLDIDADEYYWNPDFLKVESDTIVSDAVFTHLFKSICPLSGQPDFASVSIQYNGRNISHEGLLKYLISYRQHAEFSEQIVERIFVDIMNRCMPDRLTIQASFNRRGGIDINPYRSHDTDMAADVRVWRQ
ncbi:MAG: NADPH-dependent 7-cyano-7-deazaguanine reductase QueF [Pseudomonadales bacterium]|jgi:7-cyano-7-deazaguanine reductase|nr:NADPH-dependent 7-cyano-7-deazaguanine reductase QueF [Pseudomonadales bacterium]